MARKATDPVCGMKVDKDEAAATYKYEGEKFYFCAPGCKKRFKEDPEKYLDENRT